MRVVTGTRCADLEAFQSTRLPARVLAYVSWHQPCHPLHLRHQVAGWFPMGGDSMVERFHEVLEWFEQRGDLYTGQRGLLYVTPPYAVGDLAFTGIMSLSLVGHIGLDSRLRTWLANRGGQLVTEVTEDGRGLVRTVSLPPGERTAVERGLEQLGLHVISPKVLLDRMEKIWDWDAAGLNHGPLPALGSGWQAYSPDALENYQEGRWVSTDEFGDAVLVRWSPPTEGSRQLGRRYFLHGGDQQVVEISRDAALWWIYRIDDDHSRSAPWVYDRHSQILHVPERIPSSVYRFLMALVYAPVRQEKYSGRAYPIANSHLPWIRVVGEEHLGVAVKES